MYNRLMKRCPISRITNHQGDVNQNHKNINSHLSEWLVQTRQEIKVLAKMRRKGYPCAPLPGV